MSTRQMRCQVPSAILPSTTGTVAYGATSAGITCERPCPRLPCWCSHRSSAGNRSPSADSRSSSLPAPVSIRATPAVACGTKTCSKPSPRSATYRSQSLVMSRTTSWSPVVTFKTVLSIRPLNRSLVGMLSGTPAACPTSLWRVSEEIQRRRYAYLGPEGTFTEQALRSLPDAADAELQPCATVTVALDAVRSGSADQAVVPIENSVEGSVPVTLDELSQGEPLMILAEMTVPVAFSLLVQPGTSLSDIRRVATHPHAAAQTRLWVAEHLPDAEVLHSSSTAAAAAALAVGPEGRRAAPWDAAISA